MSTRIRITSKMGYRWVWQLLTPDDHVVNESADFTSRDECETEALEQGLPVVGLSKARRGSPTARVVNNDPRWHFSIDPATKLWRWQHFGADGQPLAASAPKFRTERECASDAKSYGYKPEPMPRK